MKVKVKTGSTTYKIELTEVEAQKLAHDLIYDTNFDTATHSTLEKLYDALKSAGVDEDDINDEDED